MGEIDTIYVLAASYDTKEAAEADYDAIKSLYREVQASHDFDAAIIERDDDGKAHVIKKHEQPTRHGAAKGIGWGLAVGAVAAIFPAFALGGALAAGGTAGGVIGAVKGHMQGGMKDEDLKELGDTLEKGKYGLIAVYATNMGDQIAANIKAVNRSVSAEIDARADALADAINQTES